MTTYDMKTIAANTAGPASNSAVIFGADNQGAATPVPYGFGAFRTAVQGILYAANRWEVPFGVTGVNAGGALSANNITFFLGYLPQKCTITALGNRVSTLAASGNFQNAIYANSSSMRPTGNALASTASMSTAATGHLNSAVNVQLDVGWYWWATNVDASAGSTVRLNGVSSSLAAGITGAATQANNIFDGIGVGITLAQTFGTWPDVTASSFTEGFPSTPVVQFKVGSVP
jgi:hypothetical protein